MSVTLVSLTNSNLGDAFFDLNNNAETAWLFRSSNKDYSTTTVNLSPELDEASNELEHIIEVIARNLL
jgi:hypothetical protein